MKRIVIINPFFSYKIRQDFFLKYYQDKGYNVKIVTTDYNHLQKKSVENKENVLTDLGITLTCFVTNVTSVGY
jgi:7-cyano-7-deazaguanine synthase in queuosine biosynthesis